MIWFDDPLYDGQLVRTLGHAIYGGAEVGECFAAAQRIRALDRDSWLAAWTALADRTVAAASASARGGHRESARRAYLRASNYYRAAYVFHLEAPLPACVRDCHRAHRDAFRRAAVADPIDIAWGETSLPGYFCAAPGGGKRPIVIAVGGYDSTAEESYFWMAAAANARGYHCLTFDGPGQGALLVERSQPFTPAFAQAIEAVIAWCAARDDVAGIVLSGTSFGGYLAPQAATDPRLAACVLDPPQLGLYRVILARIPLPAGVKQRWPSWAVALVRRLLARRAKHPTRGWALRRGMLVHAVATPWDYATETRRYDDDSRVAAIACPTLVCDAADDDIAANARAFYDRLTCAKQYIRFTAADGCGEHCESGNRGLFHERVFDWLDDTLADRP